MSSDPAVDALVRQAFKLRRRTIFPRDLRLPPGRKVFMQVMSKSIGRSYKAGEILQPLEVWLDTLPEEYGLPDDAHVGQSASVSGTTCVVRVQ